MGTRVEVHPTARIAAYTVLCAFALLLPALGLRYALRDRGGADAPAPALATPVQRSAELELSTISKPILPVIELNLENASLESHWSDALATALEGRTEVVVEGGRVDVLTERYAIEVDRLEKWHEAIGQAAHYALKTGKLPVAAIIVSSDEWPMSERTKDKLHLIEETCTKQGIKLILLRRAVSPR
jgi:hypothetical protein